MLKVVSFLMLLVVCGQASSHDLDRFCRQWGGADEVICDVTIDMLANNGGYFDGKYVNVIGYFSKEAYGFGGKMYVLFANLDAYNTSNLSAAIEVEAIKLPALNERLLGMNHSLVLIRGRFTVNTIPGYDYAAYPLVGRITDVRGSQSARMPWGVSIPMPRKR
jgi:hypothetical protein